MNKHLTIYIFICHLFSFLMIFYCGKQKKIGSILDTMIKMFTFYTRKNIFKIHLAASVVGKYIIKTLSLP